MEEQIDFALLQELLTPRKQIKRAEVSRLLDDTKAVQRSALKEEYAKIIAKVDSDSGFGAWVRNAIAAAINAITA
jgi:hypothetical protein